MRLAAYSRGRGGMAFMRRLPVLDKTRCAADWNAMTGDAYVRHCTQCDQKVYNLTMMGSSEAAQLVEKHEGQLCVRFFVRADGTAIARDCSPDRWRAIKMAAAIAIGSA